MASASLSPDTEPVEVLSSYEAIRESNIRRNAKFLDSMGLSGRTIGVDMERKAASVTKKRKTSSVVATTVATPVEPSRRSTRVASMKSVNYNDSDYFANKLESLGSISSGGASDAQHAKTIEEKKGKEKDIMYSPGRYKVDVKPSVGQEPQLAPAQKGTRSIDANVNIFLSEYLGRPVPHFGKAAVVTMANNGVLPSFSKYSGVLEWANCVMLWVNLGAANGYDNCFSGAGRYITWFGGSRMSGDSAVIHRLLATGKPPTGTEEAAHIAQEPGNEPGGDGDAIGDQSGSCGSVISPGVSTQDQLLLLVRREGEPYVSLGRVQVHSCNLEGHPVRIQFELVDWERLRNNSTVFEDIIS